MMRHFALVLAAALPGCAGPATPEIDVIAVGGALSASELLGWDTPRALFAAPEDPAVPVLQRRR